MVTAARYFDLVREMKQNTTIVCAWWKAPKHSRARHHQHQKTSATLEAQFVELRKTLHRFGARRLIREFDLPIGHCALERIWREHGVMEKTPQEISAQARSRANQNLVGAVPANQRGYQGSRRYPALQYAARDVRSGLGPRSPLQLCLLPPVFIGLPPQ
jgi:hypothetical protein